jgi:hypothetical protein
MTQVLTDGHGGGEVCWKDGRKGLDYPVTISLGGIYTITGIVGERPWASVPPEDRLVRVPVGLSTSGL